MEIHGFEAKSDEISLQIPSLVVKSGSFCALVAKSGGGKSVLLSVLTGHLLGPWMRRRDAIDFDRFVIGKTHLARATFAYPARLRAVLRGENLIYLPQKFPDDRSMRRRCLSEMADVIGAIAPDCPRKLAKDRLIESCRKLNLEKTLEQPLRDLSGGERKRVEILARLCGAESQSREEKEGGVIFLLDEPTSGLDIAAQRQYFKFLKETRNLFQDINITFVIATHALSMLEDEEDAIFDSVIYVRKEERDDGNKHCKVSYCGSTREFVRSAFFTDLNGRRAALPPESRPREELPIASPNPVGRATTDTDTEAPRTRSKSAPRVFLSTFDEELRRANGKQFEGKGKYMVFAIPALVGLIVFAAFLARSDTNPERFIFFGTIYAFWIGIFNSCQIVNGAVASGEWNYWVLALRRSFFGYISANALVSFLLSLVQVAVFAVSILLCSHFYDENSLYNVFVKQCQLPYDFIEHVAGISPNFLICLQLFLSLAMAAVAGVGLGTFVSCATKDTLSALKVAVGIVVVSMICSTTVLKSDQGSMPVSPPLYLKFVSPAPFLSSFASLSSEQSNAGFWPHLLEDLSFTLPQRYFFNIGRVLDMDVLEFYEASKKNKDFEYKLGDGSLANHWKHWKESTEGKIDDVRAELAEKGEFLNESYFLPAILRIIALEALACFGLSALFFSAGTLIAIRNKNNYEIH
jgi:ABC-type multidrug transport system ATPase subunit